MSNLGCPSYALFLALILIYLVLAAQFESFKDPFIIMITVPLAIAGALICLWLFGQTLNIFSEIGSKIHIQVRKKAIPATVVKLPFYKV